MSFGPISNHGIQAAENQHSLSHLACSLVREKVVMVTALSCCQNPLAACQAGLFMKEAKYG